MVDEFIAQPFHVAGAVVEVVDLGQRHRAVAVQDAVRQLEEVVSAGEADDRIDRGFVDARALADALVEDGKRVTQSAVRQTGDEVRRAVRQLQVFFLRHIGEPCGDVLGRDPVEVEPLAAGQDGGRKFVDFGRGEHELDVLRRLLERLQQRVERAGGKHVDFVDDVDAVLAADGREVRFVADLTDVVDTVVRGGVDLDDVEDGPGVDTLASLTAVAGVPVHRVLTVDCFREDLGAGRLAGTSRTGEQVGVGMPTRPHLVHEGPGDVFLPDDVREDLGSPLPVQGLICFCHGTTDFPHKCLINAKRSEAAFT